MAGKAEDDTEGKALPSPGTPACLRHIQLHDGEGGLSAADEGGRASDEGRASDDEGTGGDGGGHVRRDSKVHCTELQIATALPRAIAEVAEVISSTSSAVTRSTADGTPARRRHADAPPGLQPPASDGGGAERARGADPPPAGVDVRDASIMQSSPDG